jgi:5-methylthioadenosine/S-adenosylhomocysteine deaminase
MSIAGEEREIFLEGNSFLVAGGRLNGREIDLFIDSKGTIADLGTDLRKTHKEDADFIIDAHGTVVLPGLVNTHTHAAMTLLRGYADDMHLQDWLTQKIWPLEAHLTGDDVYWGTKLACIEMIRSGTIAFNDMYFFMDRAAQAVDEMGMKAVLAHGFIDFSSEQKREQEIRATEDLADCISAMDNPRIRAAVGPHAPYTVSKEGLEWCAEYSREKDIGIHIHLSETEKEVQDCVNLHGVRPARLLDALGCLTSRTVAAHCCWLDEDECRLLGKRGVYPSHNPVSNMKLTVNRAMPYHWLHQAGARVTLGTDGCSSNNNLDLFEEMKVAALLQKFYWNMDTLLPAEEALSMATINGARALGFGPGEVVKGGPADFILISESTPCMVPLHNAVSNVVYACSGYAVETVFCNGRVLMLEREIPGEIEILEEASRAALDLVRRSQS